MPLFIDKHLLFRLFKTTYTPCPISGACVQVFFPCLSSQGNNGNPCTHIVCSKSLESYNDFYPSEQYRLAIVQ